MKNMALSQYKTGIRIQYNSIDGTERELVEWCCPVCEHLWYELSDSFEYPEFCPECGSNFPS